MKREKKKVTALPGADLCAGAALSVARERPLTRKKQIHAQGSPVESLATASLIKYKDANKGSNLKRSSTFIQVDRGRGVTYHVSKVTKAANLQTILG